MKIHFEYFSFSMTPFLRLNIKSLQSLQYIIYCRDWKIIMPVQLYSISGNFIVYPVNNIVYPVILFQIALLK